jgi:O-antigen/teichoic acid export membrane protein
VFLNIAKIFRGVFQAFEQMHWDIVVTMVHQFLVLGLVVLAVFSQGYDLPGILTLLAVAAFVQVLFCWALVWYRYASVNIQSMSIRSSLRYLKSGFSVAVSNTCKQGSNYLGVFALKLFFGVTELAFFAAPLRILLRLRIGVMILIRAVAPEFSRRAANEPETLSGVFSFVSRIFLLLGVAGSFILILLKSLILHLILGPEFQDAALCFVIISLFLPFLFFDFFCMSFLIACNQERLNMMNNIKSFVVYIFISLAMVYFFGTFGAAVSFLFINIFISILQFISVKKIIKLKNYLFKVGVLLLSVVLGIFAIYILPKFYYTNIFAGVILFIITAYYFQYFEKKEFNSLQLLLLKKAR